MIVIFARLRSLVALLAAALVLVAAPLARADYGDPPEVEAQRLVHVLGYVGADYGGAVENGAITNQGEFDEQLSLLDDGAKIAGRIQPALPSDAPRVDLPALVAKVRGLVEKKAPASEVTAATLDARTAILGSFRLAEAPATAPNAERGRAIFQKHCTECHGEQGRGDTPKAATLNPRPANFWDPDVADAMTPFRVASTVRFGVQGTAMVPFSQLSEAERWDVAFYVVSLRHTEAPADGSPTYALAELATRSDASLRAELLAAGVAQDRVPAMLADLRKRAPYEDRGARSPLALARAKLDRARVALQRGDREGAKGQIIDSYLEGVEPVEAQLKSIDAGIVARIEDHYMVMRAGLDRGETPAELGAAIGRTLAELTAAESRLKEGAKRTSFVSTAISSGGIVVREGVEAALLIAALLGLAAQAGHSDKKRYVHAGWAAAIALGVLTFLLSLRLVTISGAKRELIEGITALLATAVLFYVSYSLLAKREVQRWMRFLKEHISPRKAALSLFGVSFLAAYREAFETVLFYQALLASDASTLAALVGAAVGAVVLVIIVATYTRAGRFAPPQVFFRISSYLLYGLAVVFIGQGLAALQMAGVVPAHRVGLPSVPVIGFYPTLETITAQLILLALAVGAYVWNKRSPEPGPPPRGATPAPAKG